MEILHAEERAESSGAGPSLRAAGIAYDVFISHCGADCKRDFAVQLKNELERGGQLRCFLDDRDLRLGDDAAATMRAAINTAKFGVVLVTEGFFRREWCIKELQTFLERGNCIPVFLERSMERQMDILEDCRSSRAWEGFGKFLWSEGEYLGLVRGVFGITGLGLEAVDGFWDTCFTKLKEELLLQLRRVDGPAMLPEPELLVGMEKHLEDIKGLMGLRAMPQIEEGGCAQEVGLVGVKGMGGVGKTTLAKLVYNDGEVRAFFGGRVCWLEVNQKPCQDKVCKLHKQILQTLGGAPPGFEVANPMVGRAEIRKRLQKGAKVLICLDDVWVDGHTPIVCKEDFSPGSCILKTTRDANTIEPGGQQHDLDVLSPKDAERLFRATALRSLVASAKVEALISRTLSFCADLPLALEVMGALVAKMLTKGDGMSQWENLLAAMKGASMNVTGNGARVLNILRTSYDVLPDQRHKDAFLFVATYQFQRNKSFVRHRDILSQLARVVFNQMDKERALSVANSIFRELVDRSLVKCNFGIFESATVHDLLVDVALGITKTVGTGFCFWQDGTLPFSEAAWKQEWEHVVVRKSAPFKLRTSFFDSNRILSFVVEDCSFEFSNARLFAFNTRLTRAVNKCRELEFHLCRKLQALPHSIKTFTNLKSLSLFDCQELRSLPRSFGELRSLEEISISSCISFQHLSSSLGRLKALIALELQNCPRLRTLPKSIGQLKSLQCLRVDGAIEMLPKSIVRLEGLKVLNLYGCSDLRLLPESIGQLTGLDILNLKECTALRSLPASLSALTGLKSLNLNRCHNLSRCVNLDNILRSLGEGTIIFNSRL